jgi:hypothetical protein
MSTMSLRLPESLHRRLREFAEKDDVSINQLITTAVAEKLAALSTLEYLDARAHRGRRKKFEAALARVPDVEAEAMDRRASARQQAPADAAAASRRRRSRA